MDDVRLEVLQLAAQAAQGAQIGQGREAAAQPLDAPHVDAALAQSIDEIALPRFGAATEYAHRETALGEQRVRGQALPRRTAEVEARQDAGDAQARLPLPACTVSVGTVSATLAGG